MEDKIEWVKAGVLARGSCPAWSDDREIALVVREYVSRVRTMGINSIVCLLSQGELVRYYAAHGVNLLAAYREAGLQLAHVPVTDHEEPPLRPAICTDCASCSPICRARELAILIPISLRRRGSNWRC